jgi:hypothetical protein
MFTNSACHTKQRPTKFLKGYLHKNMFLCCAVSYGNMRPKLGSFVTMFNGVVGSHKNHVLCKWTLKSLARKGSNLSCEGPRFFLIGQGD